MILKKEIKWVLVYSFLIVCIALGWIIIAPQQAGGNVIYIILYGNSMEPLFHLGDLILIRPSINFKIGDIVAYFNPDLGNYIFHRIIDIQSNLFLLKGDNNQWVDTYQPHPNELLGKFWLRIPYMGKVFQLLRSPISISIGIGFVLFLLYVELSTRKDKKMKKINYSTKETFNWVQIVFSILLISLSFSLFIAIITFSKSPTKVISRPLPLTHISRFSYSGIAPQGVYDNSIITEGQPIFPSLTCPINIYFGYLLDGSDLKDLNGIMKIKLSIKDPKSGWSRTKDLLPEAQFTENNININEEVDFCKIVNTIKEFEDTTNISSSYYYIDFQPIISIEGKSGNIQFTENFNPNLRFTYDHFKFVLSSNEPDQNLSLSTIENSEILKSEIVRNKFSFFGIPLDVYDFRISSIVGMMISITGITLLFIYINKINRDDPFIAHQLLQGQDIFDLAGTPPQLTNNIVFFSTFNNFSRVSKTLNELIFRYKSPANDVYFFSHDSIKYQFIDHHSIKREKENPNGE